MASEDLDKEKIDRRSITSGENAKGHGLPKGTELPTKATFTKKEVKDVIETAATAILAGNLPRVTRQLVPTTSDLRSITRVMGMPAEEFQQQVCERLRVLTEMTMDRVEEKLKGDNYKPAELSFLLSVVMDKLDKREGRVGVNGTTVNMQINNFSGPDARSRDDVIGALVEQVGT
jgi:hypothetical protein